MTISAIKDSAATDFSAVLPGVVSRYFPVSAGGSAAPVEWTTEPVPRYSSTETDEQLIARALKSVSAGSVFGNRASFADLWNCDTAVLGAAYPDTNGQRPFDASTADAALAQHLMFWTGGNCERTRLLMEQSGLVREKWNRQGDDYLRRTILQAAGKQTQYYSVRLESAAPVTAPGAPFRPSELWVAEQFAARYGTDWRFDHTRRTWLHWNGCFWELDEKAHVLQVAGEVARSIRELITSQTDGDTAKKVLSYSLKCENQHILTDVLKLAATFPELAITQKNIDSDPDLFNCMNGTIDLKTSAFREHRPDDLLTKRCNAAYDPAAACADFLAFVYWLSCGDAGMVRHLQQFFGVCLTGEPLQYLWFWYGLGANGKSVLWNVLSDFLGDYSLKSPFDMLSREGGGIPNDVARLVGSRLVVCSEIPGNAALNEALVKELTGGDKLTARFLRCEYFEFLPTHKIAIIGNHRPRVKGQDSGIWRRLLLIPFENTVPEGQRRAMPEMLAAFKREYSGILNWALEGLADYRKNGLLIFDRAKVAREEYRNSEDVLSEFLSGLMQEPNAAAPGKDLYLRYLSITGGRPMAQRNFYEALRERGYASRKSMTGIVFEGLSIPAGGF